MIKKIAEKLKNIPSNFRIYVAIGIFTFLLDYFLYLFFFHHGVSMNIAKALSSSIAVVFNYIFNSRFNFGGGNTMKFTHLVAYMGMYSVLIVIHVMINRGFYIITKEEHIAVFLAMCVSLFINYLSIRKFFAYTQKKHHAIRNR